MSLSIIIGSILLRIHHFNDIPPEEMASILIVSVVIVAIVSMYNRRFKKMKDDSTNIYDGWVNGTKLDIFDSDDGLLIELNNTPNNSLLPVNILIKQDDEDKLLEKFGKDQIIERVKILCCCKSRYWTIWSIRQFLFMFEISPDVSFDLDRRNMNDYFHYDDPFIKNERYQDPTKDGVLDWITEHRLLDENVALKFDEEDIDDPTIVVEENDLRMKFNNLNAN